MGGQIVSKTSSDGSLKYVGPHEFTNAGNDNFFLHTYLVYWKTIDSILCC